RRSASPLKILIVDTVENGVAAEIVCKVRGQPKSGTKIVAGMSLGGPKRFLAPRLPAKEVAVLCPKPHAGRTIHEPIVDRLRKTYLRFEAPAVGADVDEVLRMIVTCRHHGREAETGCGGRLSLHEFGRRKRRTSDQVLGDAHYYVAH